MKRRNEPSGDFTAEGDGIETVPVTAPPTLPSNALVVTVMATYSIPSKLVSHDPSQPSDISDYVSWAFYVGKS